jgi:hypothetical protein
MRNVMTVILLSITLFVNCSNALAKDAGVGIPIDMLPWGKVYEILPKYSKFTVLDVETWFFSNSLVQRHKKTSSNSFVFQH